MDPVTVSMVRCPHHSCVDTALTREGRSLHCPVGHSYDLARQGYVNLLANRDPGTGDDVAMVEARSRILDSGHFAPLAAAIADLVAARVPAENTGTVVDLGGGTGHYLAAVLDRLVTFRGLIVDLSKPALRRAARSHPRASAIAADIWDRLPLGDGCATAVTVIFAPRNGTEISRILAPGGVVVVATPTPGHLAELREPLGLLAVDPDKAARLASTLGANLVADGPLETVTYRMTLARTEITDLVMMGPTAQHITTAELDQRLDQLPAQVTVTCSVELRVFRAASNHRDLDE